MENKKEMYDSIVDKIKSLPPEKKMELIKKYVSMGDFAVEYKVVLRLLKDDPILENINTIKSTLSVQGNGSGIKAYTQAQNPEPKKEYGNIKEQVEKTVNKETHKDSQKFSSMLEKALHNKNTDYLDKHQTHSISPNIYTPKI